MEFLKYSQSQEEVKLIQIFDKYKPQNTLDVGCGMGRYLIKLNKLGYHTEGIEISQQQADLLKGLGYEIYITDQLSKLKDKYEIVLMSHLVEHIPPDKIINFIDSYLDKLVTGGILIIITPLMHKKFYDDYDHIKPYTHRAISFLYSTHEQFQQKPKYNLKMEELWFRRVPLDRIIYEDDFYLIKKMKLLLNKLYLILYIVSVKTISQKTGWLGVFKKV